MLLIAGCSGYTMQQCPAPASDLLTPSQALEVTGGDPDKVPEVFRHNGEVQRYDRSRLYRWQMWYKGCVSNIR